MVVRFRVVFAMYWYSNLQFSTASNNVVDMSISDRWWDFGRNRPLVQHESSLPRRDARNPCACCKTHVVACSAAVLFHITSHHITSYLVTSHRHQRHLVRRRRRRISLQLFPQSLPHPSDRRRMVLVPPQQVRLEVLRHGHRPEPHAQKGPLEVPPHDGTLEDSLVNDPSLVADQLHRLRPHVLDGPLRGQRDEEILVGLVAVVVAVRDAVVQLLRPSRNYPGSAHVPQKREIELEGTPIDGIGIGIGVGIGIDIVVRGEGGIEYGFAVVVAVVVVVIVVLKIFPHGLYGTQYGLGTVHGSDVNLDVHPEKRNETHPVTVSIQIDSVHLEDTGEFHPFDRSGFCVGIPIRVQAFQAFVVLLRLLRCGNYCGGGMGRGCDAFFGVALDHDARVEGLEQIRKHHAAARADFAESR
mmetsp:Transcript_25248/g.69602  ORF Transcript_25248/g.69602 Transcript_25248/m.69602 type:complete len:413 (-) Transcript_25248:163-1401(-)